MGTHRNGYGNAQEWIWEHTGMDMGTHRNGYGNDSKQLCPEPPYSLQKLSCVNYLVVWEVKTSIIVTFSDKLYHYVNILWFPIQL